ncbi:hypothetical protein [Phormidium tenue]|uniref:Uncharacterized protein n=1 Tax=Phormidium tenue NIES-30 TaxID=549789 RepID=A0A1U7J6L2_9CYAN|nr:hypothetical protein [Phormidium tenue]MBD2233536.1 hypothetical protein [Phormidium tenue FACHB-1052]OKH48645.1 hypothetical protein NIES30_08835 [Phormidium tenue NIES-30]
MNRNLETSGAQYPSLFNRIFRDDEGNLVIAQPPNLPILVAVTATVLQAILPDGPLQTTAELVAFGTWFTWAWLELFTGVNYFRQSLGLFTLVGLIALKLNLG